MSYYFTKSEVEQFIAEARTKYPSLQLSANQVGKGDNFYMAVWFNHHVVSTVNSPAQFEAFVQCCFAVVGDLSDDEPTSEERLERVAANYHENMAVSAMAPDDRRYCEERVYGGYVEF